MDHLILYIGMVMGDIPEVKFLLSSSALGTFSGYCFAHDFEEDGAIAMQDFVDALRSIHCHFVELDVIVGLAGSWAEYFVSTSAEGLFA